MNMLVIKLYLTDKYHDNTHKAIQNTEKDVHCVHIPDIYI